MSGVFVRTAILFSSFVISVLAEDLHLAGIHGDLVPKALVRPSSLSQFPAVEDKSSSSPAFDVGLVTPKPTIGYDPEQVDKDGIPEDSFFTNIKKRKADTSAPQGTVTKAPEAIDTHLPSSDLGGHPPFGSPSQSHEKGRALKKSHTCLLDGLERLTFPPPATSTGDTPGDLSESTALSTEEDDDD